MNHSVDPSHDKYISIALNGKITLEVMIAAISELMGHSDYKAKHSLWDFSKGYLGLSINDLKQIVRFLEMYTPENKSSANKAAMVIPRGIHQAIMKIFISMSSTLPYEYEVFLSTSGLNW